MSLVLNNRVQLRKSRMTTQQTRLGPFPIISFLLGPSLSLTHDQPRAVKEEAKLLTVIGSTTKHVYYRNTYVLYAIRL